MSIIGPIDPSWKDMSRYVVHFAKPNGGGSAFDCAISILSSRCIEARNAFGTGYKHQYAPKSVCFSEVPLHQLSRLANIRGSHGIGFKKEFVVARDGGPILYAYKDCSHSKVVQDMVMHAANDPGHPVWKLAPFIEPSGVYGQSKYLFEWEREWRVVGDFHFETEDPAFLIIPEVLHDAARGFFEDAERDHTGPSYKCPFIDPYWTDTQIAAALKP